MHTIEKERAKEKEKESENDTCSGGDAHERREAAGKV